MKDVSFIVPLCLFIGLFVTEVNAQDFNDEMKKSLRQSLITPENRGKHYPQHQEYQTIPKSDLDVLKVSPTTTLPTKSDRIQVLYPIENYKIHLNLQPTNSIPIYQLPMDSVKYEFDGKNIKISGIEMDPIVARERRRYERTLKLMKAYKNEQ